MDNTSLDYMDIEKFDNVDAEVYDKTRRSAYDIVGALNKKLEQTTGNHNLLTTNYNQQNETLIKSQKYIDMQNNKLENQKGNLQHIESTINTKTKILTDYNNSADKKDFYILLLKVTIVFILIVVLKNMLMKTFGVSPNHKRIILAILFFAYVGYVIYSYRQYNLSGSYSTAKKDAYKMAQKSVDELNKQYRDYMDYNDYETDYLQNTCGCPPPEEKDDHREDDEEEYVATGASNSGFYYKDSTSPKRRIQPPVKEGATKANYEVVYSDKDASDGNYKSGYPNNYNEKDAPHYYTLGL